jgi:formyltetrahydrofolate deformylase
MATGPTAILFTACPNQRGLVAGIAQFVFERHGDIVHSDHHIDTESGLFLMRVEWLLDGFRIPREEIASEFAPLAQSLDMRWELQFSDLRQRVAVMVSRYDHCLHDLLWRSSFGELRGDIAVVLSNHPDLRPLAEQSGVPFHVFPITPENKRAQEQKEHDLLASERIDLVVLARYMQVLSPKFIAQWPNRIINIHHSFLPAFAGSRSYQRAYERGVKLIGATGHYVTEQLDEGPIIEQDVVRVSHRDTVDDLIRKGRDLERMVLARAVRLHLECRVLAYGHKTVVFA